MATLSSASRLPTGKATKTESSSRPLDGASGSVINAAAATASLQLLLRDDHLLIQHELHTTTAAGSTDSAFSYAAALLQQHETSTTASSSSLQQQAQTALSDVERKLTLVQSLAERVSRTSPEAVAGPLLRLHGYPDVLITDLAEKEEKNDSSSTSGNDLPSSTTTLLSIRDRCHRLMRQGDVLESTARRVEGSLGRGYQRMESATTRLSRVLELSQTLKLVLKLQLEAIQLTHFDLEDVRELTRAAASTRVVEDLLQRPELNKSTIQVVQMMRPACDQVARQVRAAAQDLLRNYHSPESTTTTSGMMQLGNTLQVYFHLQELPHATWSVVKCVLNSLQRDQEQSLWSTSRLQVIFDTAQNEARLSMASSSSSSSKPTEAAWQRALMKKLRSARKQASYDWVRTVLSSSQHVFRLHRVLSRKTDPATRRVFNIVVANAPIPREFLEYNETISNSEFSVFALFWSKWCHDLKVLLQTLLDCDQHKEVADLYPAVRAASLEMLGSLQDAMQAGNHTAGIEDGSLLSSTTNTASSGVLGGSSALDAAMWSCSGDSGVPVEATLSMPSGVGADVWTRASRMPDTDGSSPMDASRVGTPSTSSLTAVSVIFQSGEYKTLQDVGLLPLQQAFLDASRARLCAPLRFMFPEGVAVDEDGVAVSVLPALPSRYDLQKLDANIRQELSLADPREGGGELSMTPMMAEVVVEMVEQFCQRAKGAVSEVGDEDCLRSDGSAGEALQHNIKVAGVMSALATSLRNAPENTFVVPYRPATSSQHEEAASLCQIALMPALHEIENMVRTLILAPLCRALNRRVAAAIARLHHGTYLEQSLEGMEGTGTSFVQMHLSALYDGIASNHLSKLPPEYATIVASTVATFSVFTFVSNASLVRPLGETARLHLTQDLADFELALDQLVVNAGNSLALAQVAHGKPYAELRAVRQMIFWTGLDSKSVSASSVAKSMLREVWVKDVRPSTVFHFLFSFGPTLLSSPHHSKRMRPEEYVSTLVQLDGSIDDGEASAWMTTMACCDSYQQRESIDSGGQDGDRRIAAILMMLGPELLRRRRH